MRYINLKDLVLPDGWEDKARELEDKLRNAATAKERSAIMDKHPIWSHLLVPLSKLSNQKCWYSEAKEVMSDRDVDHFRPKNKALNEDDSPRDGYWWLAYDWENYRFSSIYSNRLRDDKFDETRGVGGKGCYFPLFPGSHVAVTKEKLVDEEIILLDPSNRNDPGLITFDKDGKAIASTVKPRAKKRVEVSIKFYHLDHKPLEDARMEVWNRCQLYIDQIEKIEAKDDLSVREQGYVDFMKDQIRAMADKKEEFSAVVIACIDYNKRTRELGLLG